MIPFEKTLISLIDKAKVSFLASVDDKGFPLMKAILPPRLHEGVKTFYFTTNTSSRRVSQYLEHPQSAIYFYDARYFKGVLFQGMMEVLQDSDSKELIWREGDQLYYPQGVSDPDYCVLRFSAQSGRFYSDFQSRDFKVE